jgi:polyhydroxybutyrate depolymerase
VNSLSRIRSGQFKPSVIVKDLTIDRWPVFGGIHLRGQDDARMLPFSAENGSFCPGLPEYLNPLFSKLGCGEQWSSGTTRKVSTTPSTEFPDKVDDGTTVKRKVYGSGKDGTEVVLIVIEGDGHTWPGRKPPGEVNAGYLWEFFQKHPMK